MHALLGPFISLGVNGSFFIMFALFVATFFIVKFTALNRLSNTIIERDSRIDGRRHQVHQLHLEYQDIQSSLEQEMRKARLDANVVFTQIKDKAALEQRSLINAARESSAREIKNVRSNVVEQMHEEVKKLVAEVPAIAQLIVDQILAGKSTRSKKSGSSEIATEI